MKRFKIVFNLKDSNVPMTTPSIMYLEAEDKYQAAAILFGKHPKESLEVVAIIEALEVKQLAEKLGLTEPWVRILAKRNIIPGVKKGHIWLFDEEEVRRAHYKNNAFYKLQKKIK